MLMCAVILPRVIIQGRLIIQTNSWGPSEFELLRACCNEDFPAMLGFN